MDELELRRRCYASPLDTDAAYQQALAQNPQAQQLAKRIAQFDSRVQQAMTQVVAPAGLEGRILLRAGLQRRRRWQLPAAGLAMAASVLLAATLSLQPNIPASGAFGDMALAHVYHEIGNINTLPTSRIASSEVASMLHKLGGRLNGELGDIRYAYICPTPQGPGLHLVLNSADGPVTVLYLPTAPDAPVVTNFSDHRFYGVAQKPAAGGALAIIAESSAAIAQVQAVLDQQVIWHSASRA